MKGIIFLIVLASLNLDATQFSVQTESTFSPESPLIEYDAPSSRVTNGVAFESGELDIDELGLLETLVVPVGSVVEEYDGSVVRFFLTKTMQCSGHPPVDMKIGAARNYLGIAYRINDRACEISTFGEWSNQGGIASVKLLVMVPRGQTVERSKELFGPKSLANSKMDLADKALEVCYWYAGTKPVTGFTTIQTRLNYNRFPNPGK